MTVEQGALRHGELRRADLAVDLALPFDLHDLRRVDVPFDAAADDHAARLHVSMDPAGLADDDPVGEDVPLDDPVDPQSPLDVQLPGDGGFVPDDGFEFLDGFLEHPYLLERNVFGFTCRPFF